MKKCPVCHQTFTSTMILRKKASQSVGDLLGEHLSDGKGGLRCPHCKSRLRKKISVWFIPALMPYLISAILCSVDRQYAFFMIPSILLFMIFYVNLPYVPYDKQ